MIGGLLHYSPLIGPQAERAPGLLHLLPGHLDADLHDLRLQLHLRVHHCDLPQQVGEQEEREQGQLNIIIISRHGDMFLQCDPHYVFAACSSSS